MARAADATDAAADTSTGRGAPVGRRVFLGMVGLGAAGVVFGAKAQDWLEHALAPITARDGTGLSTFLPVGRFRIYSVTGDLPGKSIADYRLKVGGHVHQPLTLTFADLQAMFFRGEFQVERRVIDKHLITVAIGLRYGNPIMSRGE